MLLLPLSFLVAPRVPAKNPAKGGVRDGTQLEWKERKKKGPTGERGRRRLHHMAARSNVPPSIEVGKNHGHASTPADNLPHSHPATPAPS